MDETKPDQQTKPSRERRKMTRAEAGRKGGTSTRERYGSDFFREIGRIGGSKGGAATRRRDEEHTAGEQEPDRTRLKPEEEPRR